MATSGITTWQLSQTQIITSALRKLVVIGDGQTATATQVSDALVALNAMLKTFQAEGMPLWAITEANIPLTATREYRLGIGETINIPAPLKVTQAILVDQLAVISRPLNIYTRYDYNLLPKDASTGSVVNVCYEPENQKGNLLVWPTPDAYSIANTVVQITYQRPMDDMVTPTDTLDFPQVWSEAVIYGLAWRLSPEYGTPLADQKVLAQTAQIFLDKALSFGTEEGSFYLQPAWQRN